jgi:RND superfamily putative drug exporter
MKLQDLESNQAGGESISSAHRPTGIYRFGFAYGKFIHKTRWIVIALWVVALAASVPFAMRLPSILTGGGYSLPHSESGTVSQILSDTFHQPLAQLLIVFHSADTAASNPSFQREVDNFISRAKAYPHVEQVQVQGIGVDGKTTLVVVSFDNAAPNPEHSVGDFQTMLPAVDSASPARGYITGGPAVAAAIDQITAEDTSAAEEKALPIALVVLFIVFGTLIAALLPLTLALVAVPVALALIYLIALHTQTSIFVLNIATIVGLGISIDYSLFMTRRFRDELANGRSVDEAIGWTVSTAGEAILFSGLTVMIGFSGLLLIGMQLMTSFGIGGAVVVVAAVLVALTLLPAILSVLGPKVNSLRLPGLGKLSMPKPESPDGGGFWERWSLGVMRHPIPIVVGVGALLLVLALPVLSLNLGTTAASAVPANLVASRGLTILSEQFPSARQNPIQIVATPPDGSNVLTAENLAKVDALTSWIAEREHIVEVISLTRPPASKGMPQLSVSELTVLYTTGAYKQYPALVELVNSTTRGDTTVITAYADTQMDSVAGKAVITALHAGDQQAADGLRVLVGGSQASSMDFNDYLYGNFPRAILFILAATFVLLLVMFRSILLPLKAVLMNVLSVSAACGILVFIFQEGHFSNVLGFTAQGFIDATIPILLFCILFGLSMDYEVFLLSRIQEEWLRTRNNRYAVARGLEKTGGVITNAALLFVIVTGAFTFTQLVITKEIGLGMTVAVLVDATVIRTLLVPATMHLLGEWNWWLPGRHALKDQS